MSTNSTRLLFILYLFVNCCISACSACSEDGENKKDAGDDGGNTTCDLEKCRASCAQNDKQGRCNGDQCECYGETDSDSGADSDSDTDIDSDSDDDCTGWCPPKGCERLYLFSDSPYHTIRSSWSENYVIWIKWEPPNQKLYLYNIQKKHEKIFYETDVLDIQAASVVDGEIYWRNVIEIQNDSGTEYSSEVYRQIIGNQDISKITQNNWVEWCYTLREGALYCWYEKTGMPTELRVLYAETGQDKIISQNINLNHTFADGDDDYILFCEEDGEGKLQMMLYDESDEGPAKNISDPLETYSHAVIDDEVVYYNRPDSEGKNTDIWSYDISTGNRNAVIDDPGTQCGMDVEGNIMAYLHKNGEECTHPMQVFLYDIVNKTKRTFIEDISEHLILGVHGKYISFKHRGHNAELDVTEDHVYVCDLEEGGFVDSDGHVIPEQDGDGK